MAHHRTTLVIGCGSDLRSDDRAGREVASRVAALDLPGVVVRSVTQLVPELALDVALADVVVVVDADVTVAATTLTALDPTADSEPSQGPCSTHHLTPTSLLRLASAFGPPPAAVFVVSVPVDSLGLGERVSERTECGVERATALIEDMVRAPTSGFPRGI